jgi:MoaE-MoaD fusion protein
MRVHVTPFGVLKDWLGPNTRTIDLPLGASVADLLDRLRDGSAAHPPAPSLRGIAVSVNAEYAQAVQILHEGDEVGLLPPVSGGIPAGSSDALGLSYGEPNVVAITREPIDTTSLTAAARRPEDGAVVIFDGIVRDHSRGRRTLHLDYEAYEEMALRQMRELADEARSRFAIRLVTLVHRLGRLQIGETSVLIVVVSAHRAAAFDASRWLIDTLKTTVPIWKKETFVDGAVWAPGEPFPEKLAVGTAEAKRDA